MSDTENAAIAFDDFGRAITQDDLVAESYRPLPPGEPTLLLPPFDFEGNDDDWETHCLIERVKKRRRNQNKKETGDA